MQFILIELPVPEPGSGEVLIEMQASPIHPDLGLIMGSYGRQEFLQQLRVGRVWARW